MSSPILYGDTSENFYQQLGEFIQKTIRQELSGTIMPSEEGVIYIKKPEVCALLRVSKPTVDSHVEKGYYKKYTMGSRVFFNKQEIMAFLKANTNNKNQDAV